MDNSKAIMAFLFGCAAGAAIGFFLASDHKDEIIADLKDAANKMKDNLGSGIEQGKKLIDDLKGKADELLQDPQGE